VADDLHHATAVRLQVDGQRYTSGRRRLVEALASAGRPLTAAEVLDAARLAQSSAYRNLAVLEQCGVVLRLAGSDEFARYELAEDLTDHHHHHLICTICGTVVDVEAPAELERAVERLVAAAAEREGFATDHHRLDLIGRCATCHDARDRS
jgi:Fe2+ or Zn2+ uptake regulation protein